MKKSILAILLLSITLCSCSIEFLNQAKGNGFVTSEKRDLPPFNGIKSGMGLNIIIEPGNSNTITLEVDENLHELISTEVEDGILIIKSSQFISRATSKKIIIFNNQLNYIKAVSGSEIKSNCTIFSEEIIVGATSGAFVNLNIEATSTETRATSGAEIKIEGKTKNHASSTSSGAYVYAYKLLSQNTLVKATSGGEVNIFASKKLEAKATSGGDIDYRGNPEIVSVTSSSGGRINEKN